ncbi:MAG: hypothetical protein K2L07_12615 [Lachnospiraceae bacterium]|nr:hypothetical protein [Lachnospiraceae bacterium]
MKKPTIFKGLEKEWVGWQWGVIERKWGGRGLGFFLGNGRMLGRKGEEEDPEDAEFSRPSFWFISIF